MAKDTKFLLFSIADVQMALPLLDAIEVIDIPETGQPPMPEDTQPLRLGDRHIACIDLSQSLGLHAKRHSLRKHSRISIVIRIDDMDIGLFVDSNIVIANFPDTSLKPTPIVLEIRLNRKYFSYMTIFMEKPTLVLDKKKLFSRRDIERLQDMLASTAS